MKTKLFLIGFFITNLCHGQTYEENLDRCTKQYSKGLERGQLTNIDKSLRELRECIIGQTFPDFVATSMNGQLFSGKDLQGKVVLINFWFIACQPCIAEMPLLKELNSELDGKDFLLLSFSRDDKISLTSFLKKNNVPYPVFGASNDLIQKRFKMLFGYPTSLILDKRGKIIDFRRGGPLEEPGLSRVKGELKSIIEKALKE